MKRLLVSALFVCLATSACLAQSDAASAASSEQSSQIRGAFPTKLAKSVDSKKLKEGDTVVCETTALLHTRDGMMVPTGSKVIGHVTEAKARSKGDSESSLAIAFDKIEVGKKEIPIKGIVQALAPSLGGSGPATMAGPGIMGGGHGDAGDTATVAPPTNGVAGPNTGVQNLYAHNGAIPLVNSESQGVLGLKNLQMGKDSRITSSGKEVKLDGGTQVMIRAVGATPEAKPASK